MKTKLIAVAVASVAFLTACATGEEYRADVFDSTKVNQEQVVEIVNILMVAPAKVAVDNKANKQRAQMAGAILGAFAGALIGNGHGSRGATAGAGIGGVTGAVGGSMVPDKVVVDGVSLTYQKAGSTKILNSAQVGKPCEFKEGRAMLLSSDGKETRIQPNNPEGCKKPE